MKLNKIYETIKRFSNSIISPRKPSTEKLDEELQGIVNKLAPPTANIPVNIN